jgi:hypothetical protein
MTPNPPRGVYSEVENIIEVVKRKIVRSETELKVPPGGFRGELLAKLEGGYKESG